MIRLPNLKPGDEINGFVFIKHEKSIINAGGKKHSMSRWICPICNKEVVKRTYRVTSGQYKSCGCLNGNQKHGLRKHPIYNRWVGMKNRCFNKNEPAYSSYGGRGITVYEPWIKDFKKFYDYVTSLPGYNEDEINNKKGLSIDRINNNGNYEPGNIRWAKRDVQARNRRKPPRASNGLMGIFRMDNGKYAVKIYHNNKTHYLGMYDAEEEGAIARDEYISRNKLTGHKYQSNKYKHLNYNKMDTKKTIKKTGDLSPVIYIDIETFSGDKPSIDSFTADGRLKDPVKIEADLLKKQEEAWRKQSLNPFIGEVVCVVAVVESEEPIAFSGTDEADILSDFDDFLQDFSYPKVCGHNIIEFDGYWLFIKGLKYSLPNLVHVFGDKRRMLDTMLMMDGPAWKKMTSLDKMAKLLGFGGKGEVTGADVHDMYIAGEIEDIVSYCRFDVELLRVCYRKLSAMGVVN